MAEQSIDKKSLPSFSLRTDTPSTQEIIRQRFEGRTLEDLANPKAVNPVQQIVTKMVEQNALGLKPLMGDLQQSPSPDPGSGVAPQKPQANQVELTKNVNVLVTNPDYRKILTALLENKAVLAAEGAHKARNGINLCTDCRELGINSEKVKEFINVVQKALKDQGFDVEVTGKIDAKTQGVIKECFQAGADGKIGFGCATELLQRAGLGNLPEVKELLVRASELRRGSGGSMPQPRPGQVSADHVRVKIPQDQADYVAEIRMRKDGDIHSGIGTIEYKNGASWNGEIVDGKASGHGTFLYPPGSRYARFEGEVRELHLTKGGPDLIATGTGTVTYARKEGEASRQSYMTIAAGHVEREQRLSEAFLLVNSETSHRALDVPEQDRGAVHSITRRLRNEQETNVGTIVYQNGARWDGELDPKTLQASGWGTFSYPPGSKWKTFSGKVDSLVMRADGPSSVRVGEGSVQYSERGAAESGNRTSYMDIRNGRVNEKILEEDV